MGVMSSVSLDCQVRLFCTDYSIPLHLLFLPISMILPFSPSFVRLSLFAFKSMFSHSFFLQHLLHFGVIMDEQGLRPPPPPFPCGARS